MRGRAWTALLVVLALLCVPLSPSAATSTRPQTLVLSLPGALRGCYYYARTTSPTLQAVLDLVRPSAFTTSSSGLLNGAPGPISEAELVSVAPQTVVYSIAAGWTWSNGTPFTGEDLVAWWHLAAATDVSSTDGYRDIASITLSPDSLTATVVFATTFAGWELLFRDVGAPTTTANCTLASLASAPSLGPYEIASISPRGATLVRNPAWQATPDRFRVVDVVTNANPLTLGRDPYVDYRYTISMGQLSALSQRVGLDSHFGSSNQVVTLGFSPHRILPFQLAIRQFLSLALDRQALINQVLSPITYSQGVANSILFSQGQTGYDGPDGLGPSGQMSVVPNTTIPTQLNEDCTSCAAAVLSAAGYVETGGVWRNHAGHPLSIQLAVGPSWVDHATATLVVGQWRAAGVQVVAHDLPSDLAVTAALAAGDDDAGLYTVATGLEPFETARSWTGVNDHDTYDLGWRSPEIDAWYLAAQDSLNPDDATVDYSEINQYIANEYWVRPLFTLPSVDTWSAGLVDVNGSVALSGLIDQVPTWGYDASANGT